MASSSNAPLLGGNTPQCTLRAPRNKANMDVKSMEPPLKGAAHVGRVTVVEQLLDVGVDPNTIGVLSGAAWIGYLEVVVLCIRLRRRHQCARLGGLHGSFSSCGERA
jgi:hypothetical protein